MNKFITLLLLALLPEIPSVECPSIPTAHSYKDAAAGIKGVYAEWQDKRILCGIKQDKRQNSVFIRIYHRRLCGPYEVSISQTFRIFVQRGQEIS